MFRLWGKIFKDNRMLQDAVICNSDYTMSRTAMIFDAMDQLCYQFDLGHPVWLDALRSKNLNATTRPGLPVIILLNRLILIIWKSRCWKSRQDRVCGAQRETVFFYRFCAYACFGQLYFKRLIRQLNGYYFIFNNHLIGESAVFKYIGEFLY